MPTLIDLIKLITVILTKTTLKLMQGDNKANRKQPKPDSQCKHCKQLFSAQGLRMH